MAGALHCSPLGTAVEVNAMNDSGFLTALMGCACVLWAGACTLPDNRPLANSDEALDAGVGSPLPNGIVQSSGRLEGRSEKYRLRMSAGMPQPTGRGESPRHRLLLGPEAPRGKAGQP